MSNKPITVKQLITILETLGQDRVIVLQTDDEGNGYRLLTGFYTGLFNEEDPSVGLEEITPQEIEDGFSEEDLGDPEFDTPAVVLW